MRLFPRSAALLAASLLAAPVASAVDHPPYAGTWDCEVAQFVFTDTTYDPGDGALTVEKVEMEDGNYHLFFAEGYSIWLSDVTERTMSWLSDASGDGFSCTRVK